MKMLLLQVYYCSCTMRLFIT